VKGRSKTADLVDCCPVPSGEVLGAIVKPWAEVIGQSSRAESVIAPPSKTAAQWRAQKMEVIASALAAPYGVRVIAEVDTGKALPEHQVPNR